MHLPTVLTTPFMPDGLKSAIDAADTEGGEWGQLWGRAYETSLIAV
ncbi:MAG: hypothetical protein LC793_17540 [Thermomicrobia bacterium]|nr:hypothetical protein [Thermomicrobia bacterium]